MIPFDVIPVYVVNTRNDKIFLPLIYKCAFTNMFLYLISMVLELCKVHMMDYLRFVITAVTT